MARVLKFDTSKLAKSLTSDKKEAYVSILVNQYRGRLRDIFAQIRLTADVNLLLGSDRKVVIEMHPEDFADYCTSEMYRGFPPIPPPEQEFHIFGLELKIDIECPRGFLRARQIII